MKSLKKILNLSLILIFAGSFCNAQTNDQIKTVDQQHDKNKGEVKVPKVKQIKSARPDFSKTKGARPNIKRPAGTGIPKGAGKPGGIGKGKGR